MLRDTSNLQGCSAFLASDSRESPAQPSRPVLARCSSGTAERAGAERFVGAAFERAHRARLASFMPVLMTVSDGSNQLCGVVGCRAAQHAQLFLERYLDCPVEQLLSARLGSPIGRDEIVEIGNFACRDREAARRLMTLLPGELAADGFRWAVFTATAVVRRILDDLGAPLLELCRASAACVADTPDDWGGYYQADPRVVAGHIPTGLKLPGFQTDGHGEQDH